MSGHSKWHSIKHKKGAADAKRGKLFAVLIRQIEVAARPGGGDPESNATLRTMVQQGARQLGADRHDPARDQARHRRGRGRHLRAGLVRGLRAGRRRGDRAGAHRQPQPHSAEIKNIFSRNGGSFAEPGAVSWQFERKGIVVLDKAVARRRADARRGRRRRRRHRGPRRHVAGHDAADRAARGAHRDRGRGLRDEVVRPHDDPDDDASNSTTRVRRSQCCDSWTRSRTMTTSKPCTRTSTSPTRCSKRCPHEQHDRKSARPRRTSRCRASRTVSGATTRCRSSAAARSCSRSIPATTRRVARASCARTATTGRSSSASTRCCSASRRRTSTATRSWPTKHNFPFPLLADTDKTVIEAYGVGAPIIGVRRSVFVVDGEGIVRYADRKLIGATFVPTDKLVPVLAGLA